MSKKERISTLFIHILALVIVFVLPEFMMSIGSDHPVPPMGYGKVVVFVLVFYVEYYLILARCFSAGHFLQWKFLRMNALLLPVSFLLLFALAELLPAPHMGSHPHWPMLIRDMAMVLLTIGLSFAMSFMERIHRHSDAVRDADLSARRTELEQLKSQLNPHFLFNSLNTIYALTEFDTERARQALHMLSRLLRYALYESSGPVVKLYRELDFIRDYVALMQMRLGPAVKVTLNLEPGAMLEAEVAPMLLVVLVENAFKHGNTGMPDSFIDISVTSPSDGTLLCTVSNDYAVDKSAATGHSGVGLTNLRRRLELIYGRNASLQLHRTDSIFTAELQLQCTDMP